MYSTDIVIYGAGGLGREIAWLIEEINAAGNEYKRYNLLGFIDNVHLELRGQQLNGYPVLGGEEWLLGREEEVQCVCAIGSAPVRQRIQESLEARGFVFPALVHPGTMVPDTSSLGAGSMLCSGAKLMVNAQLGKSVLLNIGAMVGHDSVVGDYGSLYMNALLAGNVRAGACCEFGSGSFVLQGCSIAANTVVAPLSFVYKDIVEAGTYSGNPARRIRTKE